MSISVFSRKKNIWQINYLNDGSLNMVGKSIAHHSGDLETHDEWVLVFDWLEAEKGTKEKEGTHVYNIAMFKRVDWAIWPLDHCYCTCSLNE